ncbi:phosphoglycerate mutase-like protein [Suhomyces tanzawaensis NRRL Y-17324]|uniref:Phosphoglycerate mutase-like protein n=1 Tax=Suhomyces tanzawaensis NRRL Y-17324 TaxID=984487 RepID=A0A1E4SLL0_9ASCO|nr:phosphoglycerate mutase-like protein [Suhomyces tanzawaensis NRRL Y-17324]ODV80405.1 phosphoglycerate mutase-like protein [Suhomyces tanzawaensis NRRL Y-17324]
MTIPVASNTDPKVLRVFVVRHGQTDHNVQKILQGHKDIDINERGASQAVLVGKVFASIPLDDIVSSDLVRCKNTVSEIAKFHPEVETAYTYNFRERNMGPVEGMYLTEAKEKYGDNYRNMGEQPKEFRERVESEWLKVVAKNNDSTNIVLCTHGGVISMWANYLYREKGFKSRVNEEKLKFPFNTSITVIDVHKGTGEGWIQDFGSTEHLGGHFEVKDQEIR